MYNEPTILLLDNEDLVLSKLKILTGLIEARPQLSGRILAAGDILCAMNMLKAIRVDLAVVAGSAHGSVLLERIKLLQRQPDIIIIALIDGGSASTLVDIFFKSRCHLCLNTSQGTTEVVRLIESEILKQTLEKQIIVKILNEKSLIERRAQNPVPGVTIYPSKKAEAEVSS